MIPLPDNMNEEDVVQWLHGGICMVQERDGTFVPLFVDRSLGNGQIAGRAMTDGFSATRTVNLSDVRAHWPICGSLNLTDYRFAIHTERRPARQYKRTFYTRLLTVHVPRRWDARKIYGPDRLAQIEQGNKQVLRALYNPTYYTYHEALALLAEGWLSVAINPRVIVAGDDAGKRMLYYRGELAATIIGDDAQPVADELTVLLVKKAIGGVHRWM